MHLTKNSIAAILLVGSLVNAMGQINSDVIEEFLNHQPNRIIYWKYTGSKYFDSYNSSFLPVMIKRIGCDSIKNKEYHILRSNLIIPYFSSAWGENITYFYYVPVSYSNCPNNQILLSNLTKVKYNSNRSSISQTVQESEIVLNSIRQFEDDLDKYLKMVHDKYVYKSSVSSFIFMGIGGLPLAYYGLSSHKKGFKGAIYKTYGYAGVGMSIISVYCVVSEFFKNMIRSNKINKLEDKLRSFDY